MQRVALFAPTTNNFLSQMGKPAAAHLERKNGKNRYTREIKSEKKKKVREKRRKLFPFSKKNGGNGVFPTEGATSLGGVSLLAPASI